MRICSFLWVYYGYPTSAYEGVNVEEMRYHCGDMLARRDRGEVNPDIVAGVPDSGIAHAIGYANQSGVPFARPFIKYTPTWPRSFMPTIQTQRNLIAKMKLIPVHDLIQDQSLLLIDDSIVRGTTSDRIVKMLRDAGATEVHVRISSPPFLWPCYFGTDIPEREQLIAYNRSIEDIRKIIGADSLGYLGVERLEEMVGGLSICKGCFTGTYPMEPPKEDIRGDFER